MKTSQLFFDLDRTLWDFETNSQIALTTLYQQLGLREFTPHYLAFYSKYRKINAELWDLYGKNKITKEELRDQRFIRTFKALGIPDVDLAKKMAQGYLDISPNQTKLFPNTIETLEELKKQDYRLSIITNGFMEVQYHKISNSGLTPYFDEIICSEEVGISKPSKKVYDYALDKTKAKRNESIMIGDDLKADVLGAEAAGIRAVLFDPNEKNRYDNSMNRIKNLNELPFLILKL